MHPNINFGIKILRESGKKLAKVYDNALCYSASSHHDTAQSLESIESILSYSIKEQLHESFSKDEVLFSHEIKEDTNLPSQYWFFQAICNKNNLFFQIPSLCMSLSYITSEGVTHAMVYNPLTDEIFSASKGEGAQYDQRRLRHKFSKEGVRLVYDESQQLSDHFLNKDIRKCGSLPLALMMVATNRADLMVCRTQDFNSASLGAAKLICREAGLNFFKKENGLTWICSSSHLDRQTFNLKEQTNS